MRATVLVADDDRAVRTVLERALDRRGFEVRATGNGETLWSWVREGAGDVVITDVVMPGENGLDLVPRIRELRPDLRIVVISARNTLHTAVEANERGAYDYLPKPFDLNEVIGVVERALADPAPAPAPAPGAEEQLPFVGRSPAMQTVYRMLGRLTATDLTVMIAGESGTGKELAARALHDYGSRRNGPFVAINMAAIPRELVEAELFGHEKGAFTGAVSRGVGRFEQARGGTLFLDEIGDMPLEAQTRLLRVLQDGTFTTIGGRVPIRADARIVAATHRDLGRLVSEGAFREDLYYRLNVVPMRMPALRERAGDVAELARHFFARGAEAGLPFKSLSRDAVEALAAHDWPGNVRELENLVSRLAALCAEDVISGDAVRSQIGGAVPPEAAPAAADSLGEAVERHLERGFAAAGGRPANGLYRRVLREVERPLISRALAATGGNQLRAAEILGLNRNTLRKKIHELRIDVRRG